MFDYDYFQELPIVGFLDDPNMVPVVQAISKIMFSVSDKIRAQNWEHSNQFIWKVYAVSYSDSYDVQYWHSVYADVAIAILLTRSNSCLLIGLSITSEMIAESSVPEESGQFHRAIFGIINEVREAVGEVLASIE